MIACASIAAPARRVEEPVRFADRMYPCLVELEIGVLAPIGERVELAPLVPKLAGRAWSGRARRGQVHLLTRARDDLATIIRSFATFRVIPFSGTGAEEHENVYHARQTWDG